MPSFELQSERKIALVVLLVSLCFHLLSGGFEIAEMLCFFAFVFLLIFYPANPSGRLSFGICQFANSTNGDVLLFLWPILLAFMFQLFFLFFFFYS